MSVKTEMFPANSRESHTFYFRQPELCKWLHLGINHQQQSCMAFSANLIAGARYWFSDYLDYRPSDTTASVVLHFHFRGYKTSLSSNGVNLAQNLPTENPRATHFVKEIVYGSNGLLILEIPNCKPEVHKIVEEHLFLAAKCLTTKREIPQELLRAVRCRFYTDLPGVTPQFESLATFCSTRLPKVLAQMKNRQVNVPVFATLSPLPNCQVEICQEEQRLIDSTLMFTVLQNEITNFRSDCRKLLNYSFMKRNRRLRYYLEYFIYCLRHLTKLIDKRTIRSPTWNSAQVYNKLSQFWLTFFASGALTEWIIKRKQGMSILKELLDDIDLPCVPMDSISNSSGVKKIFMLKTRKARDELFRQFGTDLDRPETPEFSVLEIVSSPTEHVKSTRKKLEAFVKSIDKNEAIEYYISSSSTDEDGTILTLNSERTTSILPLKHQEELVIPGTRLFSIGNPSVLVLETDRRSDTEDFHWLELGEKTAPNHRTLLLLGATGRGKSTLVDSIVNYMLGVRWTDPFRFRIEAERNNSAVTAYTIHYVNGMLNAQPYSLTIIDTPGYCGNEKTDKETTQLVRDFLAHGNSRNVWKAVDVIGLVANATEKVSSNSHNNAMKAIPVIFDGDNIPSVHWFCTFCSQPSFPIVLEGVPPSYHIPTDIYYLFDNSALFSSNQQVGEFIKNEENWKLTEQNLETFLVRLRSTQFVATPSPSPEPNHLCTAKQMECLETISVMENDIKDLLERLEKLYKKKPHLAFNNKLIRPQATLEGETDDENQYKLCFRLVELMNEITGKINQLRDSGFRHRVIDHFKFRKTTPKACDYIRHLKTTTNPLALRLRILDQVLMLFNYLNSASSKKMPLAEQIDPATKKEGVVETEKESKV